jgi:hypothetical protein
MNTTQRIIGTGIAAIIAAIVSVGAGLDVDAANRPSPDINNKPAPAIVADSHRPSPDINVRPRPSVFTMPCPAADDIPRCDLRADTTTITGGSVTALRTPIAAGGGVVTLNIGRMTPSPR